MSDNDWLAARFEDHRGRLTAIAQRMLGSAGDADDAVQEVWIRLSRSDAQAIEHLGSWLTTVLSRVCLNVLQSRRSRPETPAGTDLPEPAAGVTSDSDPEYEALLADSIGLALLIVLDTLTPEERVSFVLHDVFAIPFEQIAPIVDRTPAATRKLASRARRRVQQADSPADRDQLQHAKLVDAFLAAARSGEFAALLAVLDPDVVLRADDAATKLGAPRETRGAARVAAFSRRAGGATAAFVNGVPSIVWTPGGEPRVVFSFTVKDERIVRIDLIADRARLRQLDVVLAGPPPPPRRRPIAGG
jgi:RNA polymerase sigma-70 factor (ECF subfamily)